ncbi:hypothetical protein E4U55_003758 [Claviceps digitariae]|nr:hypothetical protein E4U55_003758 [Claviceps digitariae]
MPKNTTTLYPNEHVGLKVSEYADNHSVPLSTALIQYHEWVNSSQPDAYFAIPLLEARVLLWLARLVNAKRVLEIGSFVGFSLAAWAEAVGQDGSVTGLEQSAEYTQLAREKLQTYGFNNVEILVGDALESISHLQPQHPYDIVFIDAKKSEYSAYVQAMLEKSQPGQPNRLLRPGALIIGDNVLRAGLVADSSEKNPASARSSVVTVNWEWSYIACLDEFNKMMHTHPRIETVLLPVLDGLCLGRLLD